MKIVLTKLWFSLIFLFAANISSQVKLPKIISDGMVLQRGTPIKIWGWASGNEEIQISFNKVTKKTIADISGKWEVEFPQMIAGGPYEMIINASNIIKLNDIMIGDVWICSGQSNMELPMKRVSWNYPDEIENSENKYLRQFYVPREWNFKEPQEDLSSGNWKEANPENTPDFSATSYFFGKELYEKHKVPIGLINTSLGGSRVQCWISEESLKKFPTYQNEAIMFRDDDLIKSIEDADRAISESWYKLLDKQDEGYKNNTWHKSELDTDNWESMNIPGYWADNDLGMVNGSVWFRKNINLSKELAEQTATLILGRIVDADSTFVNGKFVGNVTYQYPPRRYDIPLGVLKQGENLITIRVVSNSGKGGFILDKEYSLEFADSSISLEGEWKYKL
ncbi:MAG: sialate O-acetylesterase, partial [Ignavibacteriae bacterium]|nr:sialate O-acetylesterase [Ignavibacteriota bacterium]